MSRWQPGAEQRLAHAGLDLYVDQGYEDTTVAEIAERAGVTSRTFFRYFADKREVLFSGSVELQDEMVAALRRAPDDARPVEAVGAALDAAGRLIGSDRAHSARRHAVITAHHELRERELMKLSRLTDALTDGLVSRGVDPSGARLFAEAGAVVFRVGVERWVAGPPDAELTTVLEETLEHLCDLMGAPGTPSSSPG